MSEIEVSWMVKSLGGVGGRGYINNNTVYDALKRVL